MDESGTTQVSLDFTDGVALLPVQSGTLGTLSLKLSVDSTDIPVELETVTPVEAVKDLAAEAMEITVASSATEWDVRAAVEDELKSVLAGSYFLTQGGAIVVSGTESGGFTAKLFLKDDKATVTLQVTVHRSASTDFDALKPYFIRVMQGTFRFDSAEAVTADAIVQQVSALLEDEAVTPSARWEEEEGCWMLTLDQGEKSASLPLYINSEVSYDFDDADLLNYCTLRMAGDDYARISGGALEVSGTVSSRCGTSVGTSASRPRYSSRAPSTIADGWPSPTVSTHPGTIISTPSGRWRSGRTPPQATAWSAPTWRMAGM